MSVHRSPRLLVPPIVLLCLIVLRAGGSPVGFSAQHPVPDVPEHLLHTYDPQDVAGGIVSAGGIAAAPYGSIYVMDVKDHKIIHYDDQGRFLRTWGRQGSHEGQFDFRGTWLGSEALAAIGIDVAPDGDVYVAEPSNHRVQRFSPEGRRLGGWGEYGSEPGQMASPVDLAVGPDGSVWVNDFHNRRFQRFDADGQFLRSWVPHSRRPLGFTVAADGSLYVSDAQYDRPAIQRHAANGRLLASWPVPVPSRTGITGGVRGPVDIEIAPDGSIVALVAGSEDYLQRFDPETGDRLDAWRPESVHRYMPSAVAVDAVGQVHLVSVLDHWVERFTLDGRRLGRSEDRIRRAIGRFNSPAGVATDGEGGLWVADRGNDRVQRLDAVGRFSGQIDRLRALEDSTTLPDRVALDGPSDVARLPRDELVVADTQNHRLVRMNARGELGRVWSGPGDTDFSAPEGVAVDGDGRIYVADTGNHRIQVIEPDGQYGPNWGEQGTLPGQLDRPIGIALDPDGRVRVADSGNHRVQVFDTGGRLQQVLGFHGAGDGQFRAARWLAADAGGGTYVTDPTLHRLQRFDWAGRAQVGWGLLDWYSAGMMPVPAPSGVAVEPGGRVWVADAALDRIQGFEPDGRVSRLLGTPYRSRRALGGDSEHQAEGGLSGTRDMLVTRDGELVLPSGWPTAQVRRFDALGNYLGRWSLAGHPEMPLPSPDAFALGPDGLLHVLELYNDRHRIVQYTLGGAWAGAWELSGTNYASFGDLAVAADGTVYVLRRGGRGPTHVQRYLPDGRLDATWGDWEGSGRSPTVIAVAPDGEVFLGRGALIERYGPHGDFRGRFGEAGRGPGQLTGECISCSITIDIDDNGIVYIGDYGNQRIHRFTREGEFLDSWGPTYRTEIPPWDFPGVVATTADGRRVYALSTVLRAYGPRPLDSWRASYFGNRWLSERPLGVVELATEPLDLRFPQDLPTTLLHADDLSARFERSLLLPQGTYGLSLSAHGGVRLWWGERLLVDDWESRLTEKELAVVSIGGWKRLVVEYRSAGEAPALSLAIRR